MRPLQLACTCSLTFGRLLLPTLAGMAATTRSSLSYASLTTRQQCGKRPRPNSRLSSGRPGGVILIPGHRPSPVIIDGAFAKVRTPSVMCSLSRR